MMRQSPLIKVHIVGRQGGVQQPVLNLESLSLWSRPFRRRSVFLKPAPVRACQRKDDEGRR